MRLIEIRLLDGPNLYRLEPAIKIEVGIGRRRTWYGKREPERHALVRLSAVVPRAGQPARVAALADWVRRLRRAHPDGAPGPVHVHRSSDPGHWIVAWPWALGDRATLIAETALALVDRDVRPGLKERLTPRQARGVERAVARIGEATGPGPSWIRDADRRLPIVSISGTNGKTTTTRLTAHILREGGKRVGATTSDGIVVGNSIVEPGDWTGPGGAHAILHRDDLDAAILETARGGILLRGVGYESNEASVITNVSSDHMDLQGIHTLPELVEVKSVIAKLTKPAGWVILNADDWHVAGIARAVRGQVAFFSVAGDRSPRVRRHLAGGGRAYLVREGRLGEADGDRWRPIAALADVPVTLGGVARHNVANALAATGAARALGVSLAVVKRGLQTFVPSTDDSRGRLNVFRDDRRVVVVDFAHNEAGVAVLLDVVEAIARSAGDGRRAPISAIVGLAGDRPDDTLRGIGRVAGQRAQRIAIKETRKYLRGRSRESMIGEMLAGVRAAGRPTSDIPVYETETEALRAEIAQNGSSSGRREAGRVVVLMCHEEREEVFRLLDKLGARPIDIASELTELVPRLQGRPRRA